MVADYKRDGSEVGCQLLSLERKNPKHFPNFQDEVEGLSFQGDSKRIWKPP